MPTQNRRQKNIMINNKLNRIYFENSLNLICSYKRLQKCQRFFFVRKKQNISFGEVIFFQNSQIPTYYVRYTLSLNTNDCAIYIVHKCGPHLQDLNSTLYKHTTTQME